MSAEARAPHGVGVGGRRDASRTVDRGDDLVRRRVDLPDERLSRAAGAALGQSGPRDPDAPRSNGDVVPGVVGAGGGGSGRAISSSTRVEAGSTRGTVPSKPFATQRAPSPTASPVGVTPTLNLLSALVSGSMREHGPGRRRSAPTPPPRRPRCSKGGSRRISRRRPRSSPGRWPRPSSALPRQPELPEPAPSWGPVASPSPRKDRRHDRRGDNESSRQEEETGAGRTAKQRLPRRRRRQRPTRRNRRTPHSFRSVCPGAFASARRDDTVERGRQLGAVLVQRRRRFVHMSPHHRHAGAVVEGRSPAGHS